MLFTDEKKDLLEQILNCILFQNRDVFNVSIF